MSMTYTSLVAQIQRWCKRSDSGFVASIPDFIFLTEQFLSNTCDSIGQLLNVAGRLETSNATLDKPARWRRTIHLNIGIGDDENERKFLLNRDYSDARNYNPDDSVLGTPEFYSDYDFNHFLISPTPDSAYPFELRYLELVTPINASNQTNWLTDNAPHVLFYGCMMEANRFLQNFDTADSWKALFIESATSLNDIQKQRLKDGSFVRDTV